MTARIRWVKPEDAARIREIYAPYVLHTPVTFECSVPSVQEFEERIAHTMERYPYLVFEMDGRVEGYAYASSFHTRQAYQWDAETSIYVNLDMQRGGVGRALYEALLFLLREQGYCNAYACLGLPNEQSERFHRSLGFSSVGIFQRAGFKNGQWHDVLWMEKNLRLCEHPAPPVPADKLEDPIRDEALCRGVNLYLARMKK
ncbi:GNAT family N-acetyltransferase [Gehongia tenuis]|uniref:N-acetyltransferase n=1 Tax=Gehongia tenuis TaxID=2763655 RepID=A0A926D6I2_9FIRM|nr:GNAT family N-acetyltransferase [Gehongia tenuis]MBC8532342.1 N-acetyltransferase [Gehongia tenuis]